MRYLMGIDNGGTFSKAAIFDETGRQIAAASERTEVLTPQKGWAERDLAELWAVNARVVRRAVEESGIAPKDIAGVSFSGHGKGLYLIDREGRPLGRGILSMDSRAQAIAQRWKEDGTADAVRALTRQPLLACQPPALLAFLKAERPAFYEQIGGIFAVKDYIRYRLTGEAFGEYSDFSGGNLIDFSTKDYSGELLRLFGIEEVKGALPPLRHAGDCCGRVTREAAEETGLAAGTPVAAGMFDIDACGLASGLVSTDRLAMIAGTWSINEYIAHEPVESDTTLNSFYAIPGYYLVEESSPTSAGNMEWFLRHVMQEEERAAKEAGGSIYDLANAWVESVAPDASRVIFLPYLNGSPDAANAAGVFAGLTLGTEKRHMLRAVYEGVVFSHKRHYERLLAHRTPPARIQLSGGAANSRVWAQMFADILETPVEVVAGKELGALGAAMAAGVAGGVFASLRQASERCTAFSDTFCPRAELAPVYRKKYAAFARLAATIPWDAF